MPALRACSPAAMPCLIVGANLMSTARLRWKSAYIFFLVLVTAQWGRCCCQQEQQRQEADVCNDGPAATHSDADTMATYPRAPDKSTRLVRELLSPFSLQDFAENYWERMPLVIRGRCASSTTCTRIYVLTRLFVQVAHFPQILPLVTKQAVKQHASRDEGENKQVRSSPHGSIIPVRKASGILASCGIPGTIPSLATEKKEREK